MRIRVLMGTILTLTMMVRCGWGQEVVGRWRYGVGVATQNMYDGQTTVKLNQFEGYRPGDDPFNPLRIGWYFDWNYVGGEVVDDIQYMPLVGGWGVGVHPTRTQIEAAIAANPAQYPDGTTWLIGNEIVWDDGRTPEVYALDYHEFYTMLKDINPAYQVAIGSVITSVSYNRPWWSGTVYELLDQARAAYQSHFGVTMPVDVWNIHPYVWTKPTAEEELDDLENQLDTFRTYMQSIGEGDKPLIITEYGLLNYHPMDRMIAYLLGSFEILESSGHSNGLASDGGRWVQRWAWFVMNNHRWELGGPIQWDHCKLYDGETFTMTELGEAYMLSWKVGIEDSNWQSYR
jgi:hypothetical protein